MASAQCQKPSDQTNHQVQATTYQQKTTTTETCHCKNKTTSHNEQHSFTDKVKEMAHSARNMFHHHDNKGSVANNGHAVNNHVQKPTANSSSTTGAPHGGVRTEKKKTMTVKKTEGGEGHCMPKMLDHMKMNKKKKNKAEKHSGSSSDSGSSSESDNETCKNKVTLTVTLSS